jgi:hypothetical protein
MESWGAGAFVREQGFRNSNVITATIPPDTAVL